MASLFATGIASLCASMAAGQYNDACNKAVDAGTRQVGIRQTVDHTEDQSVQYVNMQIQENTNKQTQSVLGVIGIAYKIQRDRRIVFRLPNFGLCSSIANEIRPDSDTLTVSWNF